MILHYRLHHIRLFADIPEVVLGGNQRKSMSHHMSHRMSHHMPNSRICFGISRNLDDTIVVSWGCFPIETGS